MPDRYGYERTIHRTTTVDVELGPDGDVVSVWFRCMMIPFTQHKVSAQRADEMRRAFASFKGELLAVDVEINPP